MHDVHSIAEKYLQDIQSGKVSFYQEEQPDLLLPGTGLTPDISDRVVITRSESPVYLAGIKPSGRPVWTHCLKLASSYDTPSDKLINVLERMDMYQIEVDTMPATWFSNHNA
jgi:hypothetical protein